MNNKTGNLSFYSNSELEFREIWESTNVVFNFNSVLDVAVSPKFLAIKDLRGDKYFICAFPDISLDNKEKIIDKKLSFYSRNLTKV